MKPNPKPHIFIGIDPGKRTGICVWDAKEKCVASLLTTGFWDAYRFIGSFPRETTTVVIETPNAKRVLYRRKDADGEGRGRERMAANVGSNRREAELLAEGLDLAGFTVERITPTRTKWTAYQLERLTGITERTNEHVRDAIRLVYGR